MYTFDVRILWILTKLGAKDQLDWHHVFDICFLQWGFSSAALLTYGTRRMGKWTRPCTTETFLFASLRVPDILLLAFMCVHSPPPVLIWIGGIVVYQCIGRTADVCLWARLKECQCWNYFSTNWFSLIFNCLLSSKKSTFCGTRKFENVSVYLTWIWWHTIC